MKELGITTYYELISYHIAKTRDILSAINENKKAMYWSNEDTFYMIYKSGDVV